MHIFTTDSCIEINTFSQKHAAIGKLYFTWHFCYNCRISTSYGIKMALFGTEKEVCLCSALLVYWRGCIKILVWTKKCIFSHPSVNGMVYGNVSYSPVFLPQGASSIKDCHNNARFIPYLLFSIKMYLAQIDSYYIYYILNWRFVLILLHTQTRLMWYPSSMISSTSGAERSWIGVFIYLCVFAFAGQYKVKDRQTTIPVIHLPVLPAPATS